MWDTVGENENLEDKETYRATFWLKLPDTKEWKDKAINVIKTADKWIHSLPSILQFGYKNISITNVQVGAASESNATGTIKPWPLRITFIVKLQRAASVVYSENENIAIPAAVATLSASQIFALFVGIIALAAIGFIVVGKQLEKLTKPLSQPWFAILAVVGIYLIVRRK